MTIDAIIKSARTIDACGANVSRALFFAGYGKKDPYPLDPVLQLVDVSSLRPNSVMEQVKRAKGCRIIQNNLIRQTADEEDSKRLEGLEDLESFGFIEKYDHGKDGIEYRIYFIAKKLCGARFTLCKELAHIYTDTVDGADGSPDALLKCALDWRSLLLADPEGLDAETTGFYHAIETLIPWSLREQFIAIKNDFATFTTEEQYMRIAQTFMIPVKVVDHFCRCHADNIPYCGFSYELNSKSKCNAKPS